MKPQLPTEPSRDPDRISRAWIAQLLRCVRWAMEHPKADGRTIRQDSGVLTVTQAAANGGSGGGSNLAWVKLTGLHADSPTGGDRVYTAALYAYPNSTNPSGTVTARIPDGGNWIGPPNGWSSTAMPRMAAIPILQIWVGASESHTETVYWIMNPFRWY